MSCAGDSEELPGGACGTSKSAVDAGLSMGEL